MHNNIINIDAEIMSGTPVFNGTRVPIKNLFDYIETGANIDRFIDDFPSVTKEQAVGIMQLSENILLNPNYSFTVIPHLPKSNG
ncbi:MAG: DUF433 domain-containing protein [Bacteroidia bacterium]